MSLHTIVGIIALALPIILPIVTFFLLKPALFPRTSTPPWIHHKKRLLVWSIVLIILTILPGVLAAFWADPEINSVGPQGLIAGAMFGFPAAVFVVVAIGVIVGIAWLASPQKRETNFPLRLGAFLMSLLFQPIVSSAILLGVAFFQSG